MLPYKRPDPPAELTDNAHRWTEALLQRLNDNRTGFYWPEVSGVPINQTIEPILRRASQNHCAYCDGYPPRQIDNTIDHFQPKSLFPQRAFDWNNLFPCCDNCNTVKLEQYAEQLINPQFIEDFFQYFRVDYTTYELVPNAQDPEMIAAAAYTIEVFGLNHRFHIYERQRAFGDKQRGNYHADDLPYRYLF